MFLVTIWWFVSARKWFKGPKVNIEHLMLGREDGNVVHGVVDGGHAGAEGDVGIEARKGSMDKIVSSGDGR